MNQLYSSLNKAGLMFKRSIDQEDVVFILLETNENGTTEVDVKTFEDLFEDVKGSPTYEALSGSHTFRMEETQYTMTAEEMGYQKYFDQGLLYFHFRKRLLQNCMRKLIKLI